MELAYYVLTDYICSAHFILFSVVTKWNYLVQCAWTVFSAVCIVQCRNEVELSCSVRTDCAECGTHCSESEQSGTIVFSAHGLCSARFILFNVATNRN